MINANQQKKIKVLLRTKTPLERIVELLDNEISIEELREYLDSLHAPDDKPITSDSTKEMDINAFIQSANDEQRLATIQSITEELLLRELFSVNSIFSNNTKLSPEQKTAILKPLRDILAIYSPFAAIDVQINLDKALKALTAEGYTVSKEASVSAT